MEYSTSPRIGKVKSMAGQSPFICIDKLGTNLTPTHIRQVPRASSLADAKKGKRMQFHGTPNALKPYREKSQLILMSSAKQKSASSSKNVIVNFVNEGMNQEIKILKSEIASLKSTLSGTVTQLLEQKEEFKKQIEAVESQKNAYRDEYLRVIKFLNSNLEGNSNIRESLKSIGSVKTFEGDGEVKESLLELFQMPSIENPFDFGCEEKGDIMTARFKSLSESQIEEMLNSHSEVIALEDFDRNSEEYLKIATGDRIKVLEKIDNEWWLGKINNTIGRFPVNLVLHD